MEIAHSKCANMAKQYLGLLGQPVALYRQITAFSLSAV